MRLRGFEVQTDLMINLNNSITVTSSWIFEIQTDSYACYPHTTQLFCLVLKVRIFYGIGSKTNSAKNILVLNIAVLGVASSE